MSLDQGRALLDEAHIGAGQGERSGGARALVKDGF